MIQSLCRVERDYVELVVRGHVSGLGTGTSSWTALGLTPDLLIQLSWCCTKSIPKRLSWRTSRYKVLGPWIPPPRRRGLKDSAPACSCHSCRFPLTKRKATQATKQLPPRAPEIKMGHPTGSIQGTPVSQALSRGSNDTHTDCRFAPESATRHAMAQAHC